VAGQVCFINGDRTFKDFSPRVTLDYKPSKNMLVHAQAVKGSKSGGFNTTPGLPDSVFAFEGEKINLVEAGFKAALAEGRVGRSVAGFTLPRSPRYQDPSTFRRTAVDFLPQLRQFGVMGTYEF